MLGLKLQEVVEVVEGVGGGGFFLGLKWFGQHLLTMCVEDVCVCAYARSCERKGDNLGMSMYVCVRVCSRGRVNNLVFGVRPLLSVKSI